MSKKTHISADLAEVILSPDFRQASSEAQVESASDEIYVDTKDILYGAFVDAFEARNSKNKAKARSWETRRLFALRTMEAGQNADPRLFGAYVVSLGGQNSATELSSDDLPKGSHGAVKTNDKIKSSNRLTTDPEEFLENTIKIIKERMESKITNVGPENYATGLKYFIDKMSGGDLSEVIDDSNVEVNIKSMLEGFFTVTEKEKPNFVELTNILYSIRSLPVGTLEKSHTGPIIRHLLEELPKLNRSAINVLIGSFAKIDFSEYSAEAATLLDLAIRQRGEIERSEELLNTLNIIRMLSPSQTAASSFNAIFELSSNVERESLDIFDLDFLNESIYEITEKNDTDPELALMAKDIAFDAAKRAINLLQAKKPNVTAKTFNDLKSIVQRVVDNYKRI